MKKLINNKVRYAIAMILLLMATAISCSKDDNNGVIPPDFPDDPEHTTALHVGTWRCDVDDDITFIVIKSNSKFTIYYTDSRLLAQGLYDFKVSGTYTVGSAADLIVLSTADGDKIYCTIDTSGATPCLEIDGDKAYPANPGEVPSKKDPASDNDDEGNDEGNDDGDDDNPDDDPDTPVPGDDDNSPVRVTTDGCRHTVQLEATFECTVHGASKKAEVGFYLGFDPQFGPATYRTIVAEEGYGKFFIWTNGIYGEQKYYYRAYVKDDGKEYFGEVKSFVSLPVTYTINGRTFKVIRIDDGPYGPIGMLQTEMPAEVAVNFGEHTIEAIKIGSLGGLTSYDFRQRLVAMDRKTGLPWRFPTVEEWQYAYNGGSKSKGYLYSGSNNIDDVAWHGGNSGGTAHEIATKLPNELGFYDMCGNYSEPTDDEQIQYFYKHTFMNYENLRGYFKGNAYGGNCSLDASQCTVNSKISSIIERDLMDAKKVAIRFVYSIDPAYIPPVK